MISYLGINDARRGMPRILLESGQSGGRQRLVKRVAMFDVAAIGRGIVRWK